MRLLGKSSRLPSADLSASTSPRTNAFVCGTMTVVLFAAISLGHHAHKGSTALRLSPLPREGSWPVMSTGSLMDTVTWP
jgi:hypothetical protein